MNPHKTIILLTKCLNISHTPFHSLKVTISQSACDAVSTDRRYDWSEISGTYDCLLTTHNVTTRQYSEYSMSNSSMSNWKEKKNQEITNSKKKNPHWTHLHSKIHNQFKVKWFINKRNRSGKWKRTRVTQRNFIPSINQQSNTYKASSRIIFKWSLNTYRHYPFHVFKL